MQCYEWPDWPRSNFGSILRANSIHSSPSEGVCLSQIQNYQDCPPYGPNTADYLWDGIYTAECSAEVDAANIFTDSEYESNGHHTASPWADFEDLSNVAGASYEANHSQDDIYGMPNCGSEVLQNNVSDINELMSLLKQYMEELRSLHGYMQEVPVIHKELQMTKERCESIGRGLRRFSMDLLKFKGV